LQLRRRFRGRRGRQSAAVEGCSAHGCHR
jgi:hypothetical protein